MKFKRLERVYLPKQKDFGKITKVYKESNTYIVRPDGASFTYKLKENDLEKLGSLEVKKLRNEGKR